MKKRLSAVLLALVMVLTLAVPAFAADGEAPTSGVCGYEGDNITWSVENGVLTIGGSGMMSDWARFQWEPVWYAHREKITSAVIQEGVLNLGGRAFYGCTALTSVSLPASVASIGASAFEGCESLTSVNIPDGVAGIGASAFKGCKSLTRITIPGSVTIIGLNAFQGSGLKDIYFSGSQAQWEEPASQLWGPGADLSGVTFHYNSTGPEQPSQEPEQPAQTPAELPFTDVPKGHWACGDIQYCYENALFKGKSDTSFDPDGVLTVAEAVALAGRLCWWANGGKGELPAVPDLTGVYARFYDENGKELAAFDQEHRPEAISWGGSYVALSATYDDPAYPETCTVEVGLGELFPTRTSKCTRETHEFSGGHMSYGFRGTGYHIEDDETRAAFLDIGSLVTPDIVANASVNEWWYPADFWLRYYNDYSAITDMCSHISLRYPDENGYYSTDYDAVNWFPRERADRAMFASLINGALSEELPVLNDTSAVPDVKPMEDRDADAILRLYGAGILTGVDSTGRFDGSGKLTRAQAAAILARALDPARRITLG